MFNKPFLFQVTGAVPYAKEVKGKTEKGIKVTGLHMTDEKAFLGDVELSTSAAEKLDKFLTDYSTLPIDGEVSIKFSKRKDLVLKFGKTIQSVELKQIKVKKGTSRKFDIKIMLMLPNVKSSTAALIYDNFKETEEITSHSEEPCQEKIMSQKLPQPKFERNGATAQSLAKEQLLTIMENTDHLAEVDKTGKHLIAAKSFLEMVERGEALRPGQLSYVDGIHEMCYKEAGWETPGLHIDKKRKQLRF